MLAQLIMKSSPALVDQGLFSDKNVLWSSWRAILHRGGRALLRGGHHFDNCSSYSIGIVPKYSLSEPQIFSVDSTFEGKEYLFVSTHCSLGLQGTFWGLARGEIVQRDRLLEGRPVRIPGVPGGCRV